jgi:hypothetical protein
MSLKRKNMSKYWVQFVTLEDTALKRVTLQNTALKCKICLSTALHF